MENKTEENIIHWLSEAYQLATKSPDPSTQNGAIIVSALWREQKPQGTFVYGRGYNTFPPKVKSSNERLTRPLKYSYIEHAERSAIYDAAIFGKELRGTTMFVPWAACADCARGIICSGISELVVHQPMLDHSPDHWKESISNAFEMLDEAGVQIIRYEKEILDRAKIRFNGHIW